MQNESLENDRQFLSALTRSFQAPSRSPAPARALSPCQISEASSSALLGSKKFVALYFSAHWCGPCRKFTPLLTVTYEDREDKDEVEVVFVSSDHDKDGFDEYYGEMPWAAVKFDFEGVEALREKFAVQGIPKVIVLSGKDGSVLHADARAQIVAEKKLCGIF